DRALERRRDKTPDELGIRANVNRADSDRRDIAARILAHVDRLHRLQTGDQDHKANYQRQNRALDEKVSKRLHVLFDRYESTGFGFTCGFGARSLFTVTVIPFRSLKTPVLTTISPAFNPCVIATRSPRASPTRTNCCRIACDSLPVFSSFFFSITKTESPNGAYEIADPRTTSALCFSGNVTSAFANIPGRSA